jgi:hypothetical protein
MKNLLISLIGQERYMSATQIGLLDHFGGQRITCHPSRQWADWRGSTWAMAAVVTCRSAFAFAVN